MDDKTLTALSTILALFLTKSFTRALYPGT
jgi:hypothetical protein